VSGYSERTRVVLSSLSAQMKIDLPIRSLIQKQEVLHLEESKSLYFHLATLA
jgi:hypothetical protein